MKVEQGKMVELEYTLTLDGAQVESSAEQGPLSFKVGSGKVVPGLEARIMGHEQGEELSFDVPPEEGYGAQRVELPRSNFPEGTELPLGESFSAKTGDGQNVQFIIREVTDNKVMVDHPLAEKTLHFNIKILVVREPKRRKKKAAVKAPPPIPGDAPVAEVEELELELEEE